MVRCVGRENAWELSGSSPEICRSIEEIFQLSFCDVRWMASCIDVTGRHWQLGGSVSEVAHPTN
jgi:hypothetical protein